MGVRERVLTGKLPTEAKTGAEVALGLKNAEIEGGRRFFGPHIDLMAASASEIVRQDEAVSARFAEGFEQMVGAIQVALKATMPVGDWRRRDSPGDREIAAGSI